jgi:hypothetical protein
MSNLLSQASLVMIPSGYKEDVVYSQIPTNGNGDLSFTRASNGTRVNSAGLVEVCPWNLQTYSEDFSNASWVKNNSPVMAYNVATAPNGTMTADSIQSNTASFYQSVVAPSLSIAPNSTVTLSIYIKKETSKTYFSGSYLYFTGGTQKLTYFLFDEVNGTINIVAPDQVSMVTSVESVGDWWRFIVTGTDTGGNTNLGYAFYGTLSQNGTTLDTGIGSVRTIWGAQLNIGSTAKPYFPTTDRLNVPRLTYQNGGGGCPSLLLEKQSTNELSYSEQFDNADWSVKDNLSVTANATTSPDGTQNADKLVEDSSNSNHRVYRAIDGTSKMFSFFAKPSGRSWVLVLCNNGNTWFDIGNGQLGTVASTSTATIENVGNGWYRCAVYNTHASFGALIGLTTGNNVTSYQGDGTSGAFVWGAQMEASSYPTSYIPTTSSSATRVADACFKTGISSLIGGGVGTWFMDFEMVQGAGSDYPFAFDLSDGTTSNRLYLYWSEPAQTWNWGGVDTGITLPSTLRKKVAVKYSSGTSKLFCNGSLISTLSLSTAFNRLDIGQRFSNTFPMDGKINQAYFLTTSLTDAECQALTTI